MQTQDIRQLAEWLAATDIDLLELRGPDVELKIHRDGAADTSAQPAFAPVTSPPSMDGQTPTRAPSPGVLLDRIPGRTTPLLVPGATVQTGDLLALLQIGSLLLPVYAPCDGWAGDWLVTPGSTVGYGMHLLNIESAASAADES